MTEYRLGVDIGGTFTDIILLGSDGSLFSRKVLSTPDDYSLAIEEGVRVLLGEVGITASSVCEFVHGSTIATNAIIERRGVRVALLTTKGFRDVLEMGRFRAPRLYDLSFRKPEPLVERRLRFEVDERTDAQGKVLRPVEQAELDRVAEWLAEEDINPGLKLMGALDDFNACLATEGYSWIGFPNADLGANDPANQSGYLEALQLCNSRTGISNAYQDFQTSRTDLAPEMVRQENEDFIDLADCLRTKGWDIGELRPDENGLLSPGDRFSSADGDIDTGEIRDCISEIGLERAGEE